MKSAVVLLVMCAYPAASQSANPLTDAVMNQYYAVKRDLIGAAEAMPEDAYDFRLTPAERAFGDWIAHTAMSNYGYCAMIKGEPPPDTTELEKTSGKAKLVQALRDSFAYCDSALKGMSDRKALSEITAGTKKVYPVDGMIALIAADSGHYGTIAAHLRAKGIEPPTPHKRTFQIPEEHKRPDVKQ